MLFCVLLAFCSHFAHALAGDIGCGGFSLCPVCLAYAHICPHTIVRTGLEFAEPTDGSIRGTDDSVGYGVWDDSTFLKGRIKNGSFCCKPRASCFSLKFNSIPASIQSSRTIQSIVPPFLIARFPYGSTTLP